ncbi:AI-2E family transporter [Sphaerospermopsis aphanizomenoides BCCUSP55]|uniref:AI-2E family transporter n=1 Tax=Sphaerospermopsis aphanizomenoides TaxID=459663 RepID=UPI00190817AC|nr:AI-2E family transporter [Sphaerospermopsis aphanizomenoides]MBK1986556.1 AI-2E family transporter [Sphaerospermopsis aphanizomenoides BCCUSP55]
MKFSLEQLLKWLILTLLFPLIFLNGWLLLSLLQYFQPLVTTLVLAILLAFILNYPVSVVQQWGMKRNYAVTLVVLLTVIILAAVGITLIPNILQQFHEMVKLLPQWIETSVAKLQNLNIWFFGQRWQLDLSQIFTNIINRLPNELEYISDQLFSLIINTIDSISETLITGVLTIYLLIDGERIVEGFLKKLPVEFGQAVKHSLQQNFQNYLIGQISLALLMGISQTLMFLVFRVQFGLLFGLSVGIFSLIPFGDVVSLIVIILIVASHDFWLAVKILVVAVVIDQLIDQAIAPRLLGKFTGIRPIWVIISLLVGTYIAGVLGLLIAVPVAGVIKDTIDAISGEVENEAGLEISEASGRKE